MAGWIERNGNGLLLIAAVTAMRVASLIASHLPLYGDEAQYWVWSRDLSFGYFSKPPVIAWLVALTTTLGGCSELAIRLGSPLLHGVTAVAVAALGARVVSPRVGAWAGVVYALMPAVSVSSAVISTDVPLVCFFSLALLAYTRAIEGDLAGDWLALGALAGLALLSKYTAVVFLVGAALHLAILPGRRWRRSGPWVALATALALLLPNLLWNARHGFVAITHVAENAAWDRAGLHPLRALEFVVSQFGVFGPVPFAALLAVLCRWRALRREPAMLLLACFSAPLLLVMTVQGLVSKANANWAAPSYVAASIIAAAALLEKHRRVLAVSLALHGVVAVAVAFAEPARRLAGIEPPARLDPAVRMRGWREAGRGLAALRAVYPGHALLGDDRLSLGQLAYYSGTTPDELFFWPPSKRPRNHYELRNPLHEARGRDFLLVGLRPLDPRLRREFQAVEPLPPIVIPTHPDRVLMLHTARLRGYCGGPCPGEPGPAKPGESGAGSE